MVGYKHRYAEDPVQSRRRTDDDVVRPDHRPAGDRADRRVVHPRRLPPHRVERRRTAPAATRSTAPSTGCSTGTGLRAATSSAPASSVVGYECDGCELTYGRRPARPARPASRSSPPRRPRRSTEHTTPLPLAPGGRYELEFHAERLGVDPEVAAPRPRRARRRDGRGGGTVVTVGCTDWAYGLDDPAVDRVTRNILTRLG